MIKSHIPGSLEYLEDDSDPSYCPIDRLIERYVSEELEYAQFGYLGVDYLILVDSREDDTWVLFTQSRKEPNGELIGSFSSFLDLLDTPIFQDGGTVRTAFIKSDAYIN